MKKKCLFLLILAIAIFFRSYWLDRVPPSASLDEASIGYNAFSILKTGADEYGTKFPLLLRAYDDWRPALYVYLVIPFVKILGLNVLAVRLPSAILSVLTIIATYFLIKELFSNCGGLRSPDGNFLRCKTSRGLASLVSLLENLSGSTAALALIVAFLLAISPWHIYLSRLGHEVNAGLAFFIFAMFFSFYKKAYPATIFFILSFISYQSEKIFIPMMLLGMAIIYRKELLNQWKKIILILILSFIVLIPFTKETLQPNALIRFKGTSILEAKKEELAGKTGLERRFLMGQIIMKNYLLHFNPQWLFTNSGAESHKVPSLGIFYLWEAPLMAIGILYLLKNSKQKTNQLLLWWILVAPLPATLTTQVPHAMRTMQMLPVPQVLVAIGIYEIFHFVQNDKKIQFFSICFLSFFILLFSFFSLYRNYFVVFPKEQSKSFQYALKDAVFYANQHQGEYSKIVFSNQNDLYQSYMFFLFYTRYDPKLYQQQGGTKSGGFAETHKFGKFEFRPIDWNKEKKDGKNLYIVNPTDLSESFKTFFYLDGKEGIKIVIRDADL